MSTSGIVVQYVRRDCQSPKPQKYTVFSGNFVFDLRDASQELNPGVKRELLLFETCYINPYPTAFPYGNGMVLHFYQQQESSTTKTVHKVINKGLKTYV